MNHNCKLMKVLFSILLFVQISILVAQRPGGGRGGNFNQNQNTGTRVVQKFESQKFAGILEYDAKKTLKKLKLKKSDSVASFVISEIDKYNQQVKQIGIDNKDLFEGLDIVVNQNMETARSSQNRELMRETMGMVREKLNPIREVLRSKEEILNNNLSTHLSEEQQEKWLKYQKDEKDKIMPKRRNGNDARNRPDNYNQNRRRRG